MEAWLINNSFAPSEDFAAVESQGRGGRSVFTGHTAVQGWLEGWCGACSAPHSGSRASGSARHHPIQNIHVIILTYEFYSFFKFFFTCILNLFKIYLFSF